MTEPEGASGAQPRAAFSLAATFPLPGPRHRPDPKPFKRTYAARELAGAAMTPEGAPLDLLEQVRSKHRLPTHVLNVMLVILWQARLLGWVPEDVDRLGYDELARRVSQGELRRTSLPSPDGPKRASPARDSAGGGGTT